MSELKKVKGKIIANRIAWTCPVCNGKNDSGLGESTAEKIKCYKCPKDDPTWVIVETKDG